jgi:hypothetical protein
MLMSGYTDGNILRGNSDWAFLKGASGYRNSLIMDYPVFRGHYSLDFVIRGSGFKSLRRLHKIDNLTLYATNDR